MISRIESEYVRVVVERIQHEHYISTDYTPSYHVKRWKMLHRERITLSLMAHRYGITADRLNALDRNCENYIGILNEENEKTQLNSFENVVRRAYVRTTLESMIHITHLNKQDRKWYKDEKQYLQKIWNNGGLMWEMMLRNSDPHIRERLYQNCENYIGFLRSR